MHLWKCHLVYVILCWPCISFISPAMLSNDWAEPLLICAVNSILSIFIAWHGSTICCYSGRTHVCQEQIFLDVECLLAITACGPCEQITDHAQITHRCVTVQIFTLPVKCGAIYKCFLNYMSTFGTLEFVYKQSPTCITDEFCIFFVMMSWTLPWWCHLHHISNHVLL